MLTRPSRTELKVLTYNTFFLPQGFPYLVANLCEWCDERVARLPAQLGGYDVIVFQELFDEGYRNTLLAGLRAEYPFQTSRLGNETIGVINGGVVIVSKIPFDGPHQERLFHGACNGRDCSADKGVMYIRLRKETGERYHVFGTHTDAFYERPDYRARTEQFEIIRDFVAGLNIPDTEPVLIAGDMNAKRDAPSGNLSSAYISMIGILRADKPNFAGTLQVTYDFGINPLATDQEDGRSWLDYILARQTHLVPLSSSLEVRPFRSPSQYNNSGFRDLSDHYGVYGHLVFEHPR